MSKKFKDSSNLEETKSKTIGKKRKQSDSTSRRGRKKIIWNLNEKIIQKLTPGELMVFGAGDMGQLGLGEKPALRMRQKPFFLKSLSDKFVVDISSGSLHNAALLSNGEVWTWGCNDEYALGRGGSEMIPGKVEGLEDVKIVQVKCGASHSIALSSTGQVYFWGTYRAETGGVIDLPNMEVHTLKRATLVEKLKKNYIIQIACGDHHDLALTNVGKVYMWGWRISKRQSDRNLSVTDRLIPRLVHISEKVDSIFSFAYSNFAITVKGNVYAWGLNNYGQLGIKDDISIVVPQKVSAFDDVKVKEFAGGVHHSLALSEDNHVYSFGRGHYGRLGHGDEKEVPFPKIIEKFENKEDPVISIACGLSHSLALTKNGNAYAWGVGDLGQLGNGGADEWTPKIIEGQRLTTPVIKISAGSQHSCLLVVKQQES